MSAIGAIVGCGGAAASDAALARMERALRIHGPDRSGRSLAGDAGLVAALGIGFTPEDRLERQPIAGERLHLAFAGWIANRSELVEMLGIPAARERTLADSALALAAWERWGSGAPARLDGSFALLLWDEAAHALFAARSILQAPPLHYHRSRERFALATAPKGIFALGDLDPEIDLRKLADGLVLNHGEGERSHYRGISRLPLGSMLRFDGETLRIERYHDPEAVPDIRFARDADYVEAARERLDRSVADHLRAVEPPAIALSSGLDSSAVAVTALDLLPESEPLVAYTAVPEPGWDGSCFGRGWQGDESGPVRALGAIYPRLELHFVDSAGRSPTADLDALLLLAEAPPRNIGNLHWGIDIARAARARGKRVLLDGAIGNATISLSGRARFAALLRRGNLGELRRQLRAASRPGEVAHGLFSRAILPLLPAPIQRAVRERRGAVPRDRRRWSAIHPGFAEAMAVDRRRFAASSDAGFLEPPSSRALVRQMLFSGAIEEGQAVHHAIETLTGVQHRSPLASRRLLDFCLGLPDEQLLHDGIDRRLARRVMAGRLPAEILDAPRGRQAADWHLRMTRELANYRRELVAMGEDPEVSGRIDVARLLRLIDDWPARPPLSLADHPEFLIAYVGLGRAIGTGRFIRWANGSNG